MHQKVRLMSHITAPTREGQELDTTLIMLISFDTEQRYIIKLQLQYDKDYATPCYWAFLGSILGLDIPRWMNLKYSVSIVIQFMQMNEREVAI